MSDDEVVDQFDLSIEFLALLAPDVEHAPGPGVHVVGDDDHDREVGPGRRRARDVDAEHDDFTVAFRLPGPEGRDQRAS